MMKNKPFRPDWISAPGDSINEILKERNITFSDFAMQINESVEMLNDLIEGRAEITPQMAQKLEKIIGASVEFWIARERKYREELIVHENSEQFLQELPIKDMIKFGWIESSNNREELLSNCLDFFQISNAKTWFKTHRDVIETSAFRTSLTFGSQTGSVAAWLRQGEIIAEKMECNDCNLEDFRQKLDSIRGLTRENNPEVFLPLLSKLCAECGIAVVVLQAPSGCRASGATRFISKKKAMLLLSFRYLSDDHFWFTFFHEAGHILLHSKNSLFVDEAGTSNAQEEKEANDFAADLLIPPQFKQSLLKLTANKRDVIRFARQIGISRGIVVGQLQYLGILKRNELNSLKQKFTR
jgi:plasmid maintenance system antidote protein VapI/Zn-dependent peptidase ImmA (M78 family)